MENPKLIFEPPPLTYTSPEVSRVPTDRDNLLIAYGAMKATLANDPEVLPRDVVSLIENHLGIGEVGTDLVWLKQSIVIAPEFPK